MHPIAAQNGSNGQLDAPALPSPMQPCASSRAQDTAQIEPAKRAVASRSRPLHDWRAGAELFQWLLCDHDVSANWGNWQYFSGVGADPKRRHYRVVSQALKFDPRGEYVKAWLPELRQADDDDPEAPFRPYVDTPVVEYASQLIRADKAVGGERKKFGPHFFNKNLE